jgi:tetratricopeptide (TPR) repeat protein
MNLIGRTLKLVKKAHFLFLILLGLVFLVSLSGCFEKTLPEVQTENPPAVDSKKEVDPGKAAESEQYYEQGLKLYQQYKYQEAVNTFDKAIIANPDNYKVYADQGIAICFQGNYQAGIALIEKTLSLQPDYVPAFYNMAMAYKLQHNYDKSLFWFEKTIEGDPQNTWSYYGIATIYADQGNTKESLKYLQKAIELDPGVKAVAKQQSHFDKMRSLPEFQSLVR